MLCASKIVFVVIGLCFSALLYGWHAVDIFVDTSSPFVTEKMKLTSWKWHQFWLNFMGSMTGWLAAYYFVFWRVVPCGSSFTFKSADAAVILVALLGMGGFLPLTLSLVPMALGSLVSLVKKE